MEFEATETQNAVIIVTEFSVDLHFDDNKN